MYTIKIVEKVAGTQALPILVEAWNDLFKNGLCGVNQWPLSWDMNAVLVMKGSRPVGVIGFTKQEWTHDLIINIGYVVPEYRRKGLYTKAWKALIVWAKKNKMPRIITGTQKNNAPVLAFYKSTNRVPDRVESCYRVPGVKL